MRGTRQRFRLDYRVTVFRQDTRQIIDQSAAGDVGETFDHAGRNFCEQWLIILVHAQEFFTHRQRSILAGANLTFSRIFSNKIFRASE